MNGRYVITGEGRALLKINLKAKNQKIAYIKCHDIRAGVAKPG